MTLCLAEQDWEHVVSLQIAATTSGTTRLPLISGLANTVVLHQCNLRLQNLTQLQNLCSLPSLALPHVFLIYSK